MSSIQIVLPDNSKKSFEQAPTVLELAHSIGPRLAQDTLGGVVNGELVDLRFQLKNNDKVEIVTPKHSRALEVIRHSAAHVMAQAVQEIWPDVKVTIGPVIKDGFYYDFESPRPFTPEDLEKIEKKMQEIIKRNDEVIKEVWASERAIQTFKNMGEHFKAEIIHDLNEPEVSIYKQGKWFDLCRGPHVQKMGQIKFVKVLSIAGAYWRGDEKREQLQRIYATAFFNQKDLDDYLNRLEEAKKRDHRRVGKEMGLFYISQLAPGSPFFTKKGTTIYNELMNYIRLLYKKYGYDEVISPQIYDVELYHQSGHYQNYLENMYFMEMDNKEYSAKPMNCPGHCILYASELYSYKDLPLRMADFGRLHRYEKSGVMHGLTRVRSFSQDDAHIFCTLDQIQNEIELFMSMLNEVYSTLGMPKYKVYLATRPEKRLGADDVWDKSEGALEAALKNLNIDFTVNPGDGAFYGPKIDINFFDALDRPWQLGTLQCDFNLPERFKLRYIGADNKEHRPVMLHRAVLGSLERFIGVYIEHCGGHFPLWLAPEQVRILNITDRSKKYGDELKQKLNENNFRVFFDDRNEKLGFKIREAQLAKVPYMIVIGDKEAEQQKITVRHRSGKNFEGLDFEIFLEGITKELKEKKLDSYLVNNP